MAREPDESAHCESKPECHCHALERFADDPNCPIEFDKKLNEYQIVANGHLWLIRYCPFCGNLAPPSKRDSLFAKMTPDEFARIRDLVAGLRTVKEVLATFGVPDDDIANGGFREFPETTDRPSIRQAFRQLTYRGLSPTVSVMVSVHSSGLVEFGFSGKLLSQKHQ